jgi:hypothetical protein
MRSAHSWVEHILDDVLQDAFFKMIAEYLAGTGLETGAILLLTPIILYLRDDFFLALARAKVLEQRWWEDVGQSGLTDKSFQASLWSRSMAARFPHEWRETANVNHGIQDSLGDGKSRGIPTARS